MADCSMGSEDFTNTAPVIPSRVGIDGYPSVLIQTHLPFGPSVTFTVSATRLMPARNPLRVSSPELTTLFISVFDQKMQEPPARKERAVFPRHGGWIRLHSVSALLCHQSWALSHQTLLQPLCLTVARLPVRVGAQKLPLSLSQGRA